MQANHYGADLLDIVAGGHLTDQTVRWLEDKTQQLRPMLSSAANSFFDQARKMHQMISTVDATQALRNLISKKENIYSSNQIHRIYDLEGMQTANQINQRWIMAHTPIRELYFTNSLHGYGDSYINHHGETVGKDNYDYRRVMDGMMTTVVNTDVISNYYEVLKEGDNEITFHQKADIINNWNLVNHILSEQDQDPTDELGNLLG